MTFTNSVKTCSRNYFTFSGSSSRSEFWWFVLLLAILSFLVGNVPNWRFGDELHLSLSIGVYFGLGTQPSWAVNLFTAVFFIPFVAVLARRLQDVGHAARSLFSLLFLAYAVSVLVLRAFPTERVLSGLKYANQTIFGCLFLIIAVSKTQPGTNKFGPTQNEVSA
ncbi:MAG: DUF805 domain-containing protein [Roseobacter sp.]